MPHWFWPLLGLAALLAAGRAGKAWLLSRLRRSLTPERVQRPYALPAVQRVLQPCRIATVGARQLAGWYSPPSTLSLIHI